MGSGEKNASRICIQSTSRLVHSTHAQNLASEPRPSPLRIYRRVINCAWVNTLKAGKAQGG